jgi:hypothetical protein
MALDPAVKPQDDNTETWTILIIQEGLRTKRSRAKALLQYSHF